MTTVAFPTDWSVDPLGLYATFRTGPFGSSVHKADYISDGVPLINPMHIIEGELVPSSTISVSTDKAQALSEFMLREGDIIIGRRGDMGRCAVVLAFQAGWLCGTGSLIIQCNDSIVPEFMQRVLASPEIIRAIENTSVGTTMVNLNQRVLSELQVQVPPIKEQEAIAEALGDVDGLLAGLKRLIAKKRAVKTAVMQELLTGRRRLPGFFGRWEVKRLGEITTITMGRTPSRREPTFWGKGHTWLSIADLKSKWITASNEEITDLAASQMTPIPRGTLMMSFKLSIGRLAFAGCDLFTNEAICAFHQPQANPEYLYYVLGGTDFSLYGKQAVKGYTLNKESLNAVEVLCPPVDEQWAIATVLSDIDAEITALEARRAKTQAIKQGMMQELLTGRTRLV